MALRSHFEFFKSVQAQVVHYHHLSHSGLEIKGLNLDLVIRWEDTFLLRTYREILGSIRGSWYGGDGDFLLFFESFLLINQSLIYFTYY